MGKRRGRERRGRGALGGEQRAPSSRRDASGRVHLAVHRDPDGNEYVALVAPLFKEEWQNELASGAANTARAAFSAKPSIERAAELARSAMAATSRLADGFLARAPEGSLACRAGCDHCCYQVVGVTAPEALAIYEHLGETRSAEELGALTERVSALYEKGRGKSSAARFSTEFPCPFLDVEHGRCTIYAVRPLACRGMNSLSANECRTRLREPAARAAFLANGVGGQSFMEPIRAFHAVSAGLQLGLSELYGLDMHPLELTAAMQMLLTGPPSLAERWLHGERPFAEAESADLSADPAMREVSGSLAGR